MVKNLIGPVVAALALLSCLVPSLAQAQVRPPHLISASDISYPPQSVANGVVVLDVSIDDKGAVTGSTAVREVPSLTSVATSAITSWKFRPASRQGISLPSVLRVAVVFRPPAYFVTEPSFDPLSSEGNANPDEPGYQPAGILLATYPKYPINALLPGTVVLQIMIGAAGTIEGARVVRNVPPFTRVALSALNGWRFQTATSGGKPTTSTLAIAFVFTPLENG